jgi:uncharacterized protein YqjF (DUF2071 family)
MRLTLCETTVLSVEHYLKLREKPKDVVVMYQKWRDLSFLHYSLDPSEVRALVPRPLEIDTFADSSGRERAWVGLIPFWMTGVRPRFLPAMPGLSTFPETNLRTYVHVAGQKPGVWFFSLEAANRVACFAARKSIGLPYFWADMAVRKDGAKFEYKSSRKRDPSIICDATASVQSSRATAQPGTLDFFLIERYLLYSELQSKLLTVQVHHHPYPLNAMSLAGCNESVTGSAGLPQYPWEHLMFSPGVDVEIYQPHHLRPF